MTAETGSTGGPAGIDTKAAQSPIAQEVQLRLGTYVNGKLQGLEACRQGVLTEIRPDGTSVVRGELETYVCEGWLVEVPDRNLIFPETQEFVRRVRMELELAEIEKERQGMTEAETDADPTGETRRQLDGLRVAEDQRRRERVIAAERAWGFPPGTGEFSFGLMSDMAGMEEDQ